MGILRALLQEARGTQTHLGVKGFLQSPPSPNPVNADAYIILDDATGVWNGHDDEVARWDTVFDVWGFDDWSASDTHIAIVENQGVWYFDPAGNEWIQIDPNELVHALSNNQPLPAQFNGTSAGTSVEGSRSDHVHGLGTPRTPTAIALAAAVGTGTTPATDDHVHDHGAQLADSSAHTNSSGSTDGFQSKEHYTKLEGAGVLSSSQPAVVHGGSSTAGSSAQAARSDHRHDVSTSTTSPVAVNSSSGTAGSQNSLARSDHRHAHGNLTGGSLHAVATDNASGFMSAAQNTRLNALTEISLSKWRPAATQVTLPYDIVDLELFAIPALQAGVEDWFEDGQDDSYVRAKNTGIYRLSVRLNLSTDLQAGWFIANVSLGGIQISDYQSLAIPVSSEGLTTCSWSEILHVREGEELRIQSATSVPAFVTMHGISSHISLERVFLGEPRVPER